MSHPSPFDAYEGPPDPSLRVPARSKSKRSRLQTAPRMRPVEANPTTVAPNIRTGTTQKAQRTKSRLRPMTTHTLRESDESRDGDSLSEDESDTPNERTQSQHPGRLATRTQRTLTRRTLRGQRNQDREEETGQRTQDSEKETGQRTEDSEEERGQRTKDSEEETENATDFDFKKRALIKETRLLSREAAVLRAANDMARQVAAQERAAQRLLRASSRAPPSIFTAREAAIGQGDGPFRQRNGPFGPSVMVAPAQLIASSPPPSSQLAAVGAPPWLGLETRPQPAPFGWSLTSSAQAIPRWAPPPAWVGQLTAALAARSAWFAAQGRPPQISPRVAAPLFAQPPAATFARLGLPLPVEQFKPLAQQPLLLKPLAQQPLLIPAAQPFRPTDTDESPRGIGPMDPKNWSQPRLVAAPIGSFVRSGDDYLAGIVAWYTSLLRMSRVSSGTDPAAPTAAVIRWEPTCQPFNRAHDTIRVAEAMLECLLYHRLREAERSTGSGQTTWGTSDTTPFWLHARWMSQPLRDQLYPQTGAGRAWVSSFDWRHSPDLKEPNDPVKNTEQHKHRDDYRKALAKLYRELKPRDQPLTGIPIGSEPDRDNPAQMAVRVLEARILALATQRSSNWPIAGLDASRHIRNIFDSPVIVQLVPRSIRAILAQ